MRFRTEIEPLRGSFEIRPDQRIALIGSCFADEIGHQLSLDGIDATAGILGPLFNPLSIHRVLARKGNLYTCEDLTEYQGVFHCLDWASRYCDNDADRLLEHVNSDFSRWSTAIEQAEVVIITFGNTKVFETDKGVVGNCHKLPGNMFTSRRLSLEEIVEAWRDVDFGNSKVIVTLSPVRYTENGLADSTLAKATLRVTIDRICKMKSWDYFPSFEIVNDDLRDYRFYANDLKHPSEMAVSYIYEKFCEAYMSPDTRETLRQSRKTALSQAHKTIIPTK